MLRMPATAFEDDARGLVNSRMALRVLWVGAVVCAIGGIATWLQPFDISLAARSGLIGAQAALALLCIAGTRLTHAVPPRVLVLTVAWAGVAVATLTALSLVTARTRSTWASTRSSSASSRCSPAPARRSR